MLKSPQIKTHVKYLFLPSGLIDEKIEVQVNKLSKLL